MKKENIQWNQFSRMSRTAMICVWVFVSAFQTLQSQSYIEEWEEESELRNVLVLSTGVVDVDGDDAQFMKRYGMESGAFGGLEKLLYFEDLDNDTRLELEARAIAPNEDYLARLKLINDSIGEFEVGFESYLIHYDGTGGYYPWGEQTSISFFDEALELERSKLWVKAKLNLGENHTLRMKLTQKERSGAKNSLTWADSTQNGNRRGIIPSLWVIDEERTTLQIDLDGKIPQMEYNVGLVYEESENDNSRRMRRRIGESADRHVTTDETTDTEMFNTHASIRYELNDKMYLNAGTSVTRMDTVLGGSRIIDDEWDVVFDPSFQRQNYDHGYLDLNGETEYNQWVATANFQYLPSEHFQIVPSVRIEKSETDSYTKFLETNYSRGNAIEEHLEPFGDSDWSDLSTQVDFLYTGFDKWVLDATAFYSSGDGHINELEIDVIDIDEEEVVLERKTDRSRDVVKLKAGAKWYAKKGLSFAANYYYKARDNEYDHLIDSTDDTGGNRLPAFFRSLDFETHDANIRMTYRPSSKATFVTRYDIQKSKTDMRGGNLGEIESGDISTRIFSQSITFIPKPYFYFQGNVSIVSDKFNTGVDDLPENVGVAVPDFTNDYIQYDVSAHLALKNKTTLQARVFYYDSANFDTNIGEAIPYGDDSSELFASLTLTKKFEGFKTLSLQYGYFERTQNSRGGLNDFDAHILYAKWQYKF